MFAYYIRVSLIFFDVISSFVHSIVDFRTHHAGDHFGQRIIDNFISTIQFISSFWMSRIDGSIFNSIFYFLGYRVTLNFVLNSTGGNNCIFRFISNGVFNGINIWNWEISWNTEILSQNLFEWSGKKVFFTFLIFIFGFSFRLR